MYSTNDLIEEVHAIGNFPSKAALANALGTYPVLLNNWRHGKGTLDNYACWKAAEITGRPLRQVLLMVAMNHEKKPERREYLKRALEGRNYRMVGK